MSIFRYVIEVLKSFEKQGIVWASKFFLRQKMKFFFPMWAPIVLLGFCACEPTYDKRGHHLDLDAMKSLKVGQHSKKDVAEILGSPSTVSSFGEEKWYYVMKETESTAFFTPTTKNQHKCALSFDVRNVLKNIACDREGANIDVVSRTTPVSGYDKGVLQDMFGNVGKMVSPVGSGATKTR